MFYSHHPQGAAEETSLYEESILVNVIGANYIDFINPTSGEWESEPAVLARYAQEFRDKYIHLFLD